MASATECVACHQQLILEIDDSDEDDDIEMGESSATGPSTSTPNTVPDDVHLTCGCHFHWQCLLDAYTVTQCPNCNRQLTSTSSSGTEQLLVNLNNEGGLQENLDILPLLTEESYLKAYPEERKARAFLEFCREGDVQAIIDMLRSDSDDEEIAQGGQHLDILRYQDAIGDMRSGLHAAVAAQSQEVAWLLLLLASNLDLGQFPAEVLHEAEALEVKRGNVGSDIRGLRDDEGRTAEDLAREVGGVWDRWVGTGKLGLDDFHEAMKVTNKNRRKLKPFAEYQDSSKGSNLVSGPRDGNARTIEPLNSGPT